MASSVTTIRNERLVIDELLAWFAAEGRDWPWRQTRDRWIVLVAEVCLQQTQVSRAAGYVEKILERFPTVETMATAPLSELLAMWQGLGFPRRARNLHLAAQTIAQNGWPADYRDLPGVGEYTAAALQCFADELPIVPPDINTRRVLGRLFPDGAPRHSDHDSLEGNPWAWGQAVMELGQRVCRSRAQCNECPVVSRCPSAGTAEIVASPRQSKYEGSMRQRRGVLLKALTTDGEIDFDSDREAAESLVADGLASRTDDGSLLIPILGN
jgi:A/G-specific adenine glycosylase